MGIEMTTNQTEIDEYIRQQVEHRIQAVIFNLNAIGVTCVNEAKTNKTYQTRTQALLNSTGYAVVRDGIVVSGGGFEGNGATAGEAEINRLISKHPEGIFLIVVAGMNYAAYVEARNFNVLTSAELMAEQLVPEMMQELGFTK